LVEPAAVLRPRGCDRRRTRRFVFRERRSGFQRRWTPRRAPFGAALDASLVYLRNHRGALVAMLALANLLSLLDLWFTSIALLLGAAEVNPFMRYFFEASVTQAAVAKCGLVVAASLGIWALRRYRPALKTAIFFLAVYGAVSLYEIVGLTWLI
jgi:hypothetical protein